MSISIKKFVDIRSSLPEGAANARSYGGLVFTASEMMSTASRKEEYDGGAAVGLSLAEVQECFGATSVEFEFATKYYGYSSPSGNTPSLLKFAKVLNKEIEFTPYAEHTAYAVGDYVYSDFTHYKCISSVSAEENTGWNVVAHAFTATEETTALESAKAALTRINEESNDFGSFTFLSTTAKTFTNEELVAAAAVNSGFGNRYLMVVDSIRGSKTADAVAAEEAEFSDADGTCFVCGADACSGRMPMAIFAATDFVGGSVTNPMFKQFADEKPTVKNDDEYEKFKKAHVNFYGRTQSNGATIDFYQHGYNTDGTDTAVYCNEIWFKSTCESRLINLLLSNERVPANDTGVALVRSTVSEVCDSAVINGAFMAKTVGKTSASAIRNIIGAAGGDATDADAVVDGIEGTGYSVFAILKTNDAGEYIISYWVFFGTADSIRFIKGNDIGVK